MQDEKYKSKTDADVIWRLNMMGELGVFPHNLAVCSPLIVGDTLFVVTSNGVDEAHKYVAAPNAPSFMAVDKNTGEVCGRATGPGDKIMHGQWSNPVYAEPNGKPMIIFPGGDGYIRGFDPKDGELLWKFDCNPKDSVYVLGPTATKNDFVSRRSCATTSSTSASARIPNTARASAICGASTSPRSRKTRTRTCRRQAAQPGGKPQTIFDPKDAANKDSGLVWHFGGDAPDSYEGGDYLFGRTHEHLLPSTTGCVYAADYDGYLLLPRRPDRQGILGPQPQGRDLELAVLRGRQDLPGRRARHTSPSSSRARRRRS